MGASDPQEALTEKIRKVNVDGRNVVMTTSFRTRNIPLWNDLVGAKVKYDCGDCGRTQNERVPMEDYPIVECGQCNSYNIIPIVMKS